MTVTLLKPPAEEELEAVNDGGCSGCAPVAELLTSADGVTYPAVELPAALVDPD